MHKQLEVLRQVKVFLDQHTVRHLVIGGIANAVWGRPRATRDAGFKVLIGERTIGEFVTIVGTRFKFRLTIHKAIPERAKDWDDIEGVLARQGDRLELWAREQIAQSVICSRHRITNPARAQISYHTRR